MRTLWQAAPYIRRAREGRSLASPAAILAALTLAVVACILISRDGGGAPMRYGDVELQTSAGGLPGTHAWGAYGRAAAVSRSAIGWLASVPSRARSLSSRAATSARTAHLWQAASGSVATTRLQQGVDLDPSSSNHPTDPIFDVFKADPLDRARIGTGYMVPYHTCCDCCCLVFLERPQPRPSVNPLTIRCLTAVRAPQRRTL